MKIMEGKLETFLLSEILLTSLNFVAALYNIRMSLHLIVEDVKPLIFGQSLCTIFFVLPPSPPQKRLVHETI